MAWTRMDIGSIAQWIEQRESLLSGIAAAVASAGVTVAGLRVLLQRLARRTAAVGAAGAPASPGAAHRPGVAPAPRRQDIRFCTTADGVRIAWARVGEGPPLVRALGWVTNLEMEWQLENSRWIWEQFAASRRVVRYDGRGMGPPSGRWSSCRQPRAFPQRRHPRDDESGDQEEIRRDR